LVSGTSRGGSVAAPLIYVALTTMSLIMGSAFLFNDVALDDMDPVMLVTAQRVIGAVLFAVIVLYLRVSVRLSKSELPWLTLLALTNSVVPFLLISWGQTETDSGTAGVLAATTPLFAALWAASLLTTERMTWPTVAALLVGLMGIVIITGADLGNIGLATLLGDLAVVAAAANIAFAKVLIRLHFIDADKIAVAAATTFIMVAMLVPVTAATHGLGDINFSTEAWLSVIALGLGIAGFSIPLDFWLVKNAGVVKASLSSYMAPPLAIFFGWSFRGEDPGVHVFAGLILVVASLVWLSDLFAARQGAPAAVPESG
jgi:drug/metabolite transporter (DMT)-like permease